MEYSIKTVPEDFFVKEEIKLDFADKGAYSCYVLKKKNLSTIEAINLISKKLGIDAKFMNFAGTKDKKAVTEQYITIKNGPKKNFDFGNARIDFAGYLKERINLGDNSGNYFEIILGNASRVPKERNWMINYFDDQRFSEQNVEVGRAIVKKDFKKAAGFLKREINLEGNDFVNALKQIDKKILRFYIHAYQSYLWNKSVSESFGSGRKISYCLGELYVPEKKPKKFRFPIIGFGTEENKAVKKILAEEKIEKRDFIIRQIPELSSEGTEREVIVDVNNLKIEDLGDKKIKLSFTLPKGCYATMLVKQLFA